MTEDQPVSQRDFDLWRAEYDLRLRTLAEAVTALEKRLDAPKPEIVGWRP